MAKSSESPGSTEPRHSDVVIVGAGPAGLATAYELQRRSIECRVLERGDRPGFTWAHLYDSLILHTGRHLSALPGRPLPRSLPLFVPRAAYADYLADYAKSLHAPIETGVAVTRIEHAGANWQLHTSAGDYTSRALVMATGIVGNPYVPDFPGRAVYGGQVLHAAAYRRPADLVGPRLLVVGAGNSGGELASELAAAGRAVDIAIRSGVNVVPRDLAGIPTQYLAYAIQHWPRPLQRAIASAVGRLAIWRRGRSPLPRTSLSPIDAIPLLGYHLDDAVRAGRIRVRPGLARLTGSGAAFVDGSTENYDAILLATGYRHELDALGPLVRTDPTGHALRRDRVTSSDHDGLWFVGHNHDATGGLSNIARDAGAVATAIAGYLPQTP